MTIETPTEPQGDRNPPLLASDHAFAVLRRDILMGVHPPGSNLRLADLRARYEVGASPLREALFRLASQKLVQLDPNRGFRVPALDRAEWADLVAMRLRLEPPAAAAAIENGGEEWEESVLLAHRRLKRLGPASEIVTHLADADRAAQWEVCHRQFHACLISACASPWTIRFCDQLADQFDRYRRFAAPSRAEQTALAAQHDRMLDAALARDGAACAALLADHIALTGTAVGRELARLL